MAFAEAFNDRNLRALTALLCEDARAEVVGSGFPIEEGRDSIASISFPYLMNEQTPPLRAQVHASAHEHLVLLVQTDTGLLDCVARLHADARGIVQIDYLVPYFCRPAMLKIVEGTGIPVADPDDDT